MEPSLQEQDCSFHRKLLPLSEYYQKAVEAAKMFLLEKSLLPHCQNLNQILSIDRLDSYKYRDLVRTIGVEHALLSAP